jgi:hypothetical protein
MGRLNLLVNNYLCKEYAMNLVEIRDEAMQRIRKNGIKLKTKKFKNDTEINSAVISFILDKLGVKDPQYIEPGKLENLLSDPKELEIIINFWQSAYHRKLTKPANETAEDGRYINPYSMPF